MKPILIIPGALALDPTPVADCIRTFGRDAFVFPDTDAPWDDAKGLASFITANGIQGCHIAGDSLGGVTGLEFILHQGGAALVSSLSTLDSPLVAENNDAWLRTLYVLGFKKGWRWSGSPFKKALRTDPLPAGFRATQWMNDYQNGVGGFQEVVLPVVPQPHFDQTHLSLFTDPAVWSRVLEPLE